MALRTSLSACATSLAILFFALGFLASLRRLYALVATARFLARSCSSFAISLAVTAAAAGGRPEVPAAVAFTTVWSTAWSTAWLVRSTASSTLEANDLPNPPNPLRVATKSISPPASTTLGPPASQGPAPPADRIFVILPLPISGGSSTGGVETGTALARASSFSAAASACVARRSKAWARRCSR